MFQTKVRYYITITCWLRILNVGYSLNRICSTQQTQYVRSTFKQCNSILSALIEYSEPARNVRRNVIIVVHQGAFNIRHLFIVNLFYLFIVAHIIFIHLFHSCFESLHFFLHCFIPPSVKVLTCPRQWDWCYERHITFHSLTHWLFIAVYQFLDFGYPPACSY